MVVDSHCHLAGLEFAGDLADVVARAQGSGVGDVLCIISADEPDEIARVATVRDAWPAVHFAAGIHPQRAGGFGGRRQEAVRVAELAATAVGAVAIGEIGLDYHYDLAPPDVQRDVFAAQVAVALGRGLPVVIHTREAFDDTMRILKEAAGPLRGVMHCFTGTLDEARRALDLGFHLSLSGILTFPKAVTLRELAAFVPEDRLLIETDAPFLAPVPYRGRRNEPAWVVNTLEVVARVRGVSADDLGTAITKNFRTLFSLDASATAPSTLNS